MQSCNRASQAAADLLALLLFFEVRGAVAFCVCFCFARAFLSCVCFCFAFSFLSCFCFVAYACLLLGMLFWLGAVALRFLLVGVLVWSA